MNKLGKKLLVAGLCACMTAMSLAGCTAKEDKAAVTVGDDKASLGLVNLMLRFNQAQMQSLYGSFMGEDMWTTYGETTKQSVVESLENMILMEQHMEEYNVKITDEEKGKITEAAKLFVESNDAKAVKAMNATAQNTERMLTLFTVEAKMRSAIIADVDTDVSDEEAGQKTVRYVLFSTAGSVDAEGNSVDMPEEERAAKKEQAETLLEAVKGGTDMADALKEIDENRTPVTSSYGKENGTLSDALKEAAESLSDGEVADSLIETDGGYYVLEMVTTFDEEKTEAQKENIVSQRRSDKYSEVITAWREDTAISTDSDLLSKLTFQDTYELKIDESESETGTTDTTTAYETVTTEEASETETTETPATEEASETETTESPATEEASETETTEASATKDTGETAEAETTESVSETETKK